MNIHVYILHYILYISCILVFFASLSSNCAACFVHVFYSSRQHTNYLLVFDSPDLKLKCHKVIVNLPWYSLESNPLVSSKYLAEQTNMIASKTIMTFIVTTVDEWKKLLLKVRYFFSDSKHLPSYLKENGILTEGRGKWAKTARAWIIYLPLAVIYPQIF